MPAPKIDSAVICLDVYEDRPVKPKDEKMFFKVVKASFGMRRKTLLNALTGGLGIEKTIIKEVLESVDIDPKRRGETLDLIEFAKLSDAMTDRQKS